MSRDLVLRIIFVDSMQLKIVTTAVPPLPEVSIVFAAPYESKSHQEIYFLFKL